jgi:hypothetical protein
MTDQDWRGGVNSRLQSIESRLNNVEKKNAVDEVHRVNVENRLGSIESSLQWLVRLILGALILGLIGFLAGGTGIAP